MLKEFLSYEELMLLRPTARPEGDHLSDIEPSGDEGEQAPAIVAQHRHQKPGSLILFEVVSHTCSRSSDFRSTSGIKIVTVPCDQVNLTDPVTVDQLVSQVLAVPGCSLHGSLLGDGWGRKRSGYEVWKSQRTLLGLLQVAAAVLSNGGQDVVDWPQDSSSWVLPEVQAFEEQFGLKKVIFKGCALGMVTLKGNPIDAPWQIMSSSKRVIDNFRPFKCNHASDVKHEKASALRPRVAHYPQAFHEVLLMSIFPYAKPFNHLRFLAFLACLNFTVKRIQNLLCQSMC